MPSLLVCISVPQTASLKLRHLNCACPPSTCTYVHGCRLSSYPINDCRSTACPPNSLPTQPVQICLQNFYVFDLHPAAHPTACLQAQNVADLPWALVGTATISCLIYSMLALALVLLTYPNISAPAFSQFSCAPLSWVQSSPTIGFTNAFVYAHCENPP